MEWTREMAKHNIEWNVKHEAQEPELRIESQGGVKNHSDWASGLFALSPWHDFQIPEETNRLSAGFSEKTRFVAVSTMR